jgi:hypothetical protein
VKHSSLSAGWAGSGAAWRLQQLPHPSSQLVFTVVMKNWLPFVS